MTRIRTFHDEQITPGELYNSTRTPISSLDCGLWEDPLLIGTSPYGTKTTVTVFDEPNPLYYKQIENGGQPSNHNFSIVKEAVETSPCTWLLYVTKVSGTGSGCLTEKRSGQMGYFDFGVDQFLRPDMSIVDTSPQYVINAAGARALTPGYDVATLAGEGASTLRTMKSLTVDLYRQAVKAMPKIANSLNKSRRGVTAANILDEFNSRWLEARYGIRPMAYDLIGLIDAWNFESTYLNKGTASQGFDIGYDEDPVTTTSSVGTTVKQRSLVGTYKLRGHAIAEFRNGSYPLSANAFTTAWELTKFSFLVDRLLDIGSAITIATTTQGKIINLTHSAKFDYDSRVDVSHEYSGAFGDKSISGGYSAWAQLHVESYSRHPAVVAMPVFSNRLTTMHWADITAICVSQNKVLANLARSLATKNRIARVAKPTKRIHTIIGG